MFTVLHRGPDGAETIYECCAIKREQPEGEVCLPAMGRFRLLGVKMAADVPDGAEIWLNIENPFGAVFVMNRFGATVARYLSSPPAQLAKAA